MSIETTVQHGIAAVGRFPATIAGMLRFVRLVLRTRRAENELNDLSDRDLCDIGVERRQISELLRRDAARNFLLGTGSPCRHPAAESSHLAFDNEHRSS